MNENQYKELINKLSNEIENLQSQLSELKQENIEPAITENELLEKLADEMELPETKADDDLDYENQPQNLINIPPDSLIKVVNLLHWTLILSCNERRNGKHYIFDKGFGQEVLIPFSDLQAILNTTHGMSFYQKGYFAIQSRKVITKLNLVSIAENNMSLETMNQIIDSNITQKQKLALFAQASEDMRKNIAQGIARNMIAGRNYSETFILKISELSNFDIFEYFNDAMAIKEAYEQEQAQADQRKAEQQALMDAKNRMFRK